MDTATAYFCPDTPMDKIWFTFEYDPAAIEAALHPPDSGQEEPFGAEKVL